MAHIRQSRPDSGLGFQAKVFKPFELSPLRSNAAHPEPRVQIAGGEWARAEAHVPLPADREIVR